MSETDNRRAARHVIWMALCALCVAGPAAAPRPALAQAAPTATATLEGRVTFADSDEPVHGAIVLVPRLGRLASTGDDGRFQIAGLPPGTYQVIAQREHFSADRRTLTLAAGETTSSDFELRLSPVHEHVTVTHSPTGETTTFDAFNSVTTLDTFDLTRHMGSNLGELLEDEPGIARRAFGPGPGRPIIRGFDGDRVLILQDGIRTGDLSSQSGDHSVTVDPAGLERVEVIRGPATLLYGSSASGGLVNAVTPAEAMRQQAFVGTRGQFTTDAGSADSLFGLSGNVQHAQGNWTMWAGGGGRRTGDYGTPLGDIDNSASRAASGRGGVGWFGRQAFVSLGYQGESGRHGIPFAGEFHAHGHEHDDDDHDDDHEDDHDDDHDHNGHDDDHDDDHDELDVRLDSRRHDVRLDFGVRNLQNRFIDSVRVTTSYLRWRHDEIEIEDGVDELGTAFENDAVVFRAEAQQKRIGRLSGRTGVWGQVRDYQAIGAEALAPDTRQNAFAAFSYQELDFGRFRLQFGGRLERNAYRAGARDDHDDHDDHGPDNDHDDDHDHDHDHDDDHDHEIEPPDVRDRSFTGLSASAGIHVDLSPTTAVVANLSRSYRAPALEELYNFGPHVGNLAFEIGNPDLERESNVGIDVSLKHRSPRAKGELNAYVYNISNFVFPALTGEEEDGLLVAEFEQGNSRFTGFDAKGTFHLYRDVWLHAGAGYTSARLTATGQALPRIPPFHGRVALDVPVTRLTITPEVLFAADQNRVYVEESPTGGSALVNLQAAYVHATAHAAHIIAVRGYNLGNTTYRNHTSFIKELAPEIGRGVRLTYTLRFF